MHRLVIATVAAAALVLPAAADTVKTDSDSHVDFKQLHSYCWGQVKAADPFYVNRIRDRVDHDLAAKGWQKTDSSCDVTIFATGNVRNQQEVETYYNNLGWGGRWGWRGGAGYGDAVSTTVNQPIGSLVVDMFLTSNKQLAWRGSSQRDLSTKTEKNVSGLNKDIDKMFQNFPPKGPVSKE